MKNVSVLKSNRMAESTCYRLALNDKKSYPDIITQENNGDVYYTNSCHLPVKEIKGISSTFKHQEILQGQFTGGTVIHLMMKGGITGDQAKEIIKACCTNFTEPYVSISPISRFCPDHGYVKEYVDECPLCGKPLKKFQRITGYLRCIDNYNIGKTAEFNDRKQMTYEDKDN